MYGHPQVADRSAHLQLNVFSSHLILMTFLEISEKGDVFGWGNSEYNQLSMVSQDTQVPVARHLPMRGLGRVSMVASGGSTCGFLNGNNSSSAFQTGSS